VDGLRALAALYVVTHHIGLTVWWQTPVPAELLQPFLSVLVAAFTFGHYAVSVFIVLSGYWLTLQVARHGFRFPNGALGFIDGARGVSCRLTTPRWRCVCS
jgi:peptidoglycan/LPS O-acetylase OafA/YrhL